MLTLANIPTWADSKNHIVWSYFSITMTMFLNCEGRYRRSLGQYFPQRLRPIGCRSWFFPWCNDQPWRGGRQCRLYASIHWFSCYHSLLSYLWVICILSHKQIFLTTFSTVISARNAFIQADINRYNGRNYCLLWYVFASRGLGFNARPYVDNRDVPSGCLTA